MLYQKLAKKNSYTVKKLLLNKYKDIEKLKEKIQ